MLPKLNVCLLNDSFPPLIDGVANTVFNYADIIENKLGHSIVATPMQEQMNDNYKFPVYRYPSINTAKLVGYRTGFPFDYNSVSGIEHEHVDIIHSHCPFISTLMARTLRKTVDAPIILTYHTKFDIDIQKAVKSNLIQTAALKFLAQNITACDEVWAVSKGAGENLRKVGYMGDYIVMENGVDFPKGRVTDDKIAEISKKHGLEENVPVFLFVGRMMWYKGVKISLDGLKKAHDNGESFRMIFVGDGADRAEMEEYAKKLGIYDKCIFAGAVHDRELLRAYFCRADMFLFPSTYDTNGIVVREAAACSLPSILIADSCASEGITDGRNGILIQENGEAMGDALINVCHHINDIKQVGIHASNEIYMSWEDSIYKAYQRYNHILERKRRGQLIPAEPAKEILFNAVSEICSAIDKVQTGTEKVRDKVQTGTEKVKDKMQSSAEKVKDKVQTSKDKVKETVHTNTNKVKRSVRRGTARAKATTRTVKRKIRSIGKNDGSGK